ncbi:MAG: radical SAM protein [Rhodospirillaceae bacterium]|nr:radical SAM protein [Rhodospirillaceae bacterium]
MTTIYSPMKFLGFPDRLKGVRERRVLSPVSIRIKPMNHCNHDCWYCAYRVSNLQLGEDMNLRDKIPEDKMFEIADDIVSLGVRAVTFSGGGEPLIYKPLPDVIERLAEGGVRIGSLTNGANLKGRVADAFAEHGTWVRISIDSWDDESCVESRKVKSGEFTAIMNNVRDFIARDSKCILGISFIIGKKNAPHIYDVCKMLKGIGVNHVKLAATVISNAGRENNEYHAEFQDTARAGIEKALELADESFQVLDHYHEAEERFDKDYEICPFLNFLTVIGADLNVYTCQDKAYTDGGMLGSIKDRSFKDFWFSDENHKRLYAVNPSRDCRHHCVTHAKNLAVFEALESTPDESVLDALDIDPDHGVFV